MIVTLRQLIADNDPLIVPSIYDGISARLVRQCGFRAAYIGSYATGATKYGIPDLGYLSLEDMADQVRRLAPLAEVPLIVDGEGGWGNPVHVARAVQVLERAGAAATHIEDHVFGKHLTLRPRVLPVGEAVDKIKAAVDARDSADFLIIARTDAAGTEGDAAAVERALAYEAAGADAVFVASPLPLDQASYERLRTAANVPIVSLDLPGQSLADYRRQGANVVIYYAVAHLAAQAGMEAAYRGLAERPPTQPAEDMLLAILEFDQFLGIDDVRSSAERLGLIQ